MINILITYAVNDERIGLNLPGCRLRYVRTGIGKIKATLRLTDALYEECPDMVLNIGTAGSVCREVGDVVVCSKFVDRDFQKIQLPGIDCKVEGTYFFRENKIADEVEEIFGQWTKEGCCNTGDSFLTEAIDAEGDVFDMEAYAQALVCREKGIPFLAVKYVTDVIGRNSVKHWEDKLADAREGLSSFIRQNMASGSYGNAQKENL